MVELPAPLPAPAVWLILGLMLGIIISLTTGEGRVEEISSGQAAGSSEALSTRLVGERQSGLNFLVVAALAVFDVLKAL